MRSNERLRVLFVINGLGTGGAERSLAEMLPLLAQHEVDALVACLHGREEGVQERVLRAGFDVRFVRSRHFLGRVRELSAIADEWKPDLIHTTIFESDLVGRLAGRRIGCRVLTSLVNTSYDPVRLADPSVRRWKLRAAQAADGWTARRWNTCFHAITNTVKEAAVRDLRVDPELITVIPRGRDAASLGDPGPERRRQTRQRLAIPVDATVVLNVGRQEYQKGQQILLDAAAELLPRDRNLVFLIAGRPGNETNNLVSLHDDLRLGERVRFLGHRDDVPDLLAAADVFVFPSLYEGLGGAVIEAMFLGLPIVASDLPVMREVVEEDGNALLFQRGSASALAKALGDVLGDRGRADAFGRRSREIAVSRFGLDAVADRSVALYRELVDMAQMEESRGG
jgi:glycosyltransferase involved in cell wall biosynthesis